jgi:hypothetical protein
MLDALQQKLDSLLAAGLTDEIRVLFRRGPQVA